MEQLSASAPVVKVADFMWRAATARTAQDRRSLWPFLSANDRLFLSSGLSSFYSELMKGLGAGGRLWELLERQPQLPFNGGSGWWGMVFAGVLKSMLWTVRPVFCRPQRMGHCQEVTSASEQGEGQDPHGTLLGTLQGMFWKWADAMTCFSCPCSQSLPPRSGQQQAGLV